MAPCPLSACARIPGRRHCPKCARVPARQAISPQRDHHSAQPRVGTLTGTLEATGSAPRSAEKWTVSSESVPVAQPPTAAGQLYGEQVTPVAAVAQSMVSGIVQPELANAVAAKTRPRTTLYFKRDITTPSVKEKCFARGELYYVSGMRNAMGFTKFAAVCGSTN